MFVPTASTLPPPGHLHAHVRCMHACVPALVHVFRHIHGKSFITLLLFLSSRDFNFRNFITFSTLPKATQVDRWEIHACVNSDLENHSHEGAVLVPGIAKEGTVLDRHLGGQRQPIEILDGRKELKLVKGRSNHLLRGVVTLLSSSWLTCDNLVLS